MKRRSAVPLFVVPLVLLSVVVVVVSFNSAGRAQPPAPAQQQQRHAQTPPTAQRQQQQGGAVAPNASGSVAAQTGEAASPRRTLQCQGCHGPGKPLPYLGGEQFHKDEHKAYGDGYHAKAAAAGRPAATCLDCHTREGKGDMTTMLPSGDPKSTVARANLALTCGRCHADQRVMGLNNGVSSRIPVSYQSSVHADALSRGRMQAAVCTDCHRGHDVLPPNDPRSPVFVFNIPQTCGQCHPTQSAEFVQSVHGGAVMGGNTQSPTCTNCHGIHNIKARADSRPTLGSTTCASCHEGVRLSQEFGIAPDRVGSFEDSYHGLARRLGSDVAADCASCHGVHNILPSSNPQSMIAPANLTQTCGQCHPGAGENFARGAVHLALPYSKDPGSVGVSWVRFFYLFVICGTVGGMAFHNLLAYRKKVKARYRAERRTVTRLTRSQRAQHWLLLTSFIVLVLSGFALVYPDSFLAYLGFETEWARRLVHRVAAAVMIAVSVYHVCYLALTREGRSWLRDMLPVRKDARDVVQFFRHHLGGRAERPKFGRFGYPEKAEYWALVWGTVVMALTGLMIWFKVGWFGWLPRWWVDIAIAVHFYEAVLATLAIVVWHFYQVVFDPEVYPVNFAFYDGKMSEEAYRHEHELDYERLKAEERRAARVEGEGSTGTEGGGAEPLPGVAGD